MSARRVRTDLRDSAASAIKKARALTNVSQIKLAELLAVSQPLVSSWECGKVTPGIDDIVRIETALNYPQGELLFAIAYPKNDPNVEART
jgi:transcriptional regulator with XRE-family HTH domain